MSECCQYKFDNATGILYKEYRGTITIEDIESSWLRAFENKIIPSETKGFILDYRKASFNMKISEHTKIAAFYRQHLDVFGNLKIAIISVKPKDVAIPTLVSLKDDGYASEPFSTVEAAINWVLH